MSEQQGIKIKFKHWTGQLEFGKYKNNDRVAMSILPFKDDPDQSPIAICTVNIPEHKIKDNEVIIKDYAENEGMYQALFDAGVVGPVTSRATTGYVVCPVCELLIKPK